MSTPQIHVFGIRHHGPGCARSVKAALDELQPEAIVLECPNDAAEALTLANHTGMQPPVSLLIYPKGEPRRSVSYPLTTFSPEWQVIRWAGEHSIPVYPMDLPMSHRMALDAAEREAAETSASGAESAENHDDGVSEQTPHSEFEVRADPLAILAEAAGYKDHELWWEEQIERRTDATGLFAAILEAMQAVRAEFPEVREADLLRESFMRKTIRKVRKETLGPVAVVCGAWHSPVLTEDAISGKMADCKVKDDNARLKGLPKVKTVATWIPWSHSRLSYQSGYGAGIESPGWYEQIWEAPDQAPLRWLTNAARLLREKDLDASSANVIESLRLADTLAAIRDLRSPGLSELNQAILTVLCQGDDAPLRLIRRKLEIGDRLGSVPEETVAVPIAENLSKLQKALRLKPSTDEKLLDLDLRKEMHQQRSHLLHRLNILNIPWGEWQQSGGGDSTFHEIWQLQWQPEFAIAVIEASVWGNTVEAAATNRTIDQGRQARELKDLTELLNQSILAQLQVAIPELLQQIKSQASVSSDLRHMMDAVLPLARIAPYSDVRQTEAADVLPIVESLFDRIIVGLNAACSNLDDAAAEEMLGSIASAQAALDLLSIQELIDDWQVQLRRMLKSDVHGLLRGWCCRLLLEKGELDSDEFEKLTQLELSTATPTEVAAAWLTGLLKGSGLLLIHQPILWKALDAWLLRLSRESFTEMLPTLRRAFSDFTGAERRQMGEKVKHLSSGEDKESASQGTSSEEQSIDHERAAKVLPVLAEIMGVER